MGGSVMVGGRGAIAELALLVEQHSINSVATSNGYYWRSREGFLWDNAYEP